MTAEVSSCASEAAQTETPYSCELGSCHITLVIVIGDACDLSKMFSLGEKMEFLIGNPFSTPVGQRIGKSPLFFGNCRNCSPLYSILHHLNDLINNMLYFLAFYNHTHGGT